jgi:hypothetical protein
VKKDLEVVFRQDINDTDSCLEPIIRPKNLSSGKEEAVMRIIKQHLASNTNNLRKICKVFYKEELCRFFN